MTSISGSPQFWSGRRVLVTGATGLLGSTLVTDLIVQNAFVVALVRDDVPSSALWSGDAASHVNIAHGDVCDLAFVLRVMNEYEIETVFHLAAQTIVSIANRHPMSTFESNIRGTYTLLDACRQYGAARAIVVASSDKAYGEHEQLPYREDAPLIGRHPYDVSKTCTDLLAQSYFVSFGLPVCVTRCGNLFGPGDLNFNRIVPGTIQSLLLGQAPVIRSDGTLIRDYFYVKDGSLAYLTLAEQMLTRDVKGQAYNFSNEIQMTVLDVVERIRTAMGSDLRPLVMATSTGEIKHQYLSAQKARTDLDWSPRYTLDQGIVETIPWYRDWLTMRGEL